jgi:hypothetical protein
MTMLGYCCAAAGPATSASKATNKIRIEHAFLVLFIYFLLFFDFLDYLQLSFLLYDPVMIRFLHPLF